MAPFLILFYGPLTWIWSTSYEFGHSLSSHLEALGAGTWFLGSPAHHTHCRKTLSHLLSAHFPFPIMVGIALDLISIRLKEKSSNMSNMSSTYGGLQVITVPIRGLAESPHNKKHDFPSICQMYIFLWHLLKTGLG